MTLAVLGLGIIGSRAGARLAGHDGRDVRLWNRTPKQVAHEVPDLAKAVEGADTVALYLKDAPATREVVGAIADQLAPGTRVLNHSTIDLDTTKWLETLAAERRWRFLDAPFTGSRDAAAEGKLVYYAGGSSDLVEEVTPLLLESGREVIHCGPVGSATLLKLVTNLVSACTVQALSEGLGIALRHGIDPASFTRAVASNACGSPLAAMKLPTMEAGDFTTHFSLENMLKDSRYVRALSEELETPAIDAVSGRMAALCDEGHAAEDFSVLASPYLRR